MTVWRREGDRDSDREEEMSSLDGISPYNNIGHEHRRNQTELTAFRTV